MIRMDIKEKIQKYFLINETIQNDKNQYVRVNMSRGWKRYNEGFKTCLINILDELLTINSNHNNDKHTFPEPNSFVSILIVSQATKSNQ